MFAKMAVRVASTNSMLLRSWFRPFASASKQHLVIALGGNALLQRGQPMTMENQQANIYNAVKNLKNILQQNSITFVHGNGPQVGMLVLEDAAYHGNKNSQTLDVLDAETEGMIGYMLEQEVDNMVDKRTVTVLSQIVVDPKDPAFSKPTKFIGPVYTQEEAQSLLNLTPQPDGVYWKGDNDSFFKRDGDKIRRVVPSPLPQRLVELDAVRLLIENDFVVICAGGGGIPVTVENGKLRGVEAVIDKDRAATMLGMALGAHGLMILTDVSAVAIDYDKPSQKWIKSVSPQQLQELMENFPDGSMGPKVSSAIEFTKSGGWCTIGSLKEADKMMDRNAGTRVTNEHGPDHIEFY
jgi:carbamate kinase